MNNNVYILDLFNREFFNPLSQLNSIAAIYYGIYNNLERWNYYLNNQCSIVVPEYLQHKYSLAEKNNKPNIYINSNIIPTQQLAKMILELSDENILVDINGFVAGKTKLAWTDIAHIKNSNFIIEQFRLNNITDLLSWQNKILNQDLKILVSTTKFKEVPHYCGAIGHENIYVEEGAIINPCFLNAVDLPIIIRNNAEIMEGACIRNGVVLHPNSCIKMNATLYGTVTVGYNSVLGGEVKNCLIGAYSNKAHHGYLGDSIIGCWCNLGAGVTNSNLKNNAQDIKMNLPGLIEEIIVGKKMGCLIGDYTKIAIETKINTGTYIGNACNILNHYELDKYVPDFTWGKNQPYQLDKLLRDIQNWLSFKKLTLATDEINIITNLYNKK